MTDRHTNIMTVEQCVHPKYKVSSGMGRDDSWPGTVLSVVPSLQYSYRRKRPGNTQNGGTVFPIANLVADSES